MPASILFVFTSTDKLLTGEPTGWYLPEAAHPYYVLSPHYDVSIITFASPAGPNPPLDPKSTEAFKEDEQSMKFLEDETVKQKLESALVLQDVKVADFDAIFYVGGHGPMFDLATDTVNAKLLEEAVHGKKILAAVCHGPGAFISAQIKHVLHKRALFYHKKITGFSNEEEGKFGLANAMPFLLEDRLTELGGVCSKAAEPLEPHVVVDGDLITGQNPASSKGVGEAIHAALQHRAQGVDKEAQGEGAPAM